ncbi:MAG: type I pullulanase [Spirochaetes bacterium GWD1_27_9]|nr:MAG: type I pullulanase [Spirochaetes bacterium GWB1_27_13]OHD26279.1 MAG: type I pullulanase [Spirochaetes bacterium GWC1_27_15]OHD32121.1 MAG: type I pullulanase [Spirochaetes bacterium GWD1_27_9]
MHKEEHYKIKLVNALMDDFNTITIYFSSVVNLDIASKISFFKENKLADYSIKSIFDNQVIINTERLDVKNLYKIGFEKNKIEVIPHKVLDSKTFYYQDNDLGLTYSKEKSVFKIFAPISTKVILNVFNTIEGSLYKTYNLKENNFGVWEITIDEDLKGKYYSYRFEGNLSIFDPKREVADPYATCIIGKSRKSLIVDLKDYPTTYNGDLRENIEDSVIYEIHVRDISIDKSSGSKNNGKYLALGEKDTYLNGDASTNIKTLVSHFKELGVNTIQIMPIQDFDNEEHDPDFYAWGYMPNFFNTVDGAYATNWKTDIKIREVKEAINFLHKEGFKVILDVVYNHTAEGFKGDGVFSFNGAVPYYYYRFGGHGYVSNGSGCGNEFRSESPMGRKFIIDSLKFWTEFYGFDGYRFDLMGLIDIDTISILIEELKKVKEDIIIYGEPWTGGTTPIQPTYKGTQKNKGFMVFNDEFRDAIKGGVFDKKDKGYVQTKGQYNYDKIIQGILGSINTFAASPIETINYVEVHDNNTLFDKLYFTITEREEYDLPNNETKEQIKAMHKLCGFLLLTSQGIPILHLGQDFLRTKFGVENSYNAGDIINKIDWNRKKEFYDVFLYYKNLIDIRSKHSLFKITKEHNLREAIKFDYDIFPNHFKNGISYILKKKDSSDNIYEKILILINPYNEEVTINLKDDWKKLLIGDSYYTETEEYCSGNLTLPALSGNILYI